MVQSHSGASHGKYVGSKHGLVHESHEYKEHIPVLGSINQDEDEVNGEVHDGKLLLACPGKHANAVGANTQFWHKL